jgi:peptide methionine sulfoxide reductase MsrA
MHLVCGQKGREGGGFGESFWEAEEEDQDYLQKHPGGETGHFVRPELPRPQSQTT